MSSLLPSGGLIDVAVASGQTCFLFLACLGLWLLLRRWLDGENGSASVIVAGGFFVRALAGALLFFISYAHLPIARSQQTGNGFWTFGQDGLIYYTDALRWASTGLVGTIAVPDGLPAPAFVQILTLFLLLFGSVASVAIALNAMCYLLAAAAVIALGKRDDRLRVPSLVALASLSFAPAGVLFSLQPLKDSFNAALLTLFVGAAVAWQDLWPADRSRRILFRAAALALAMFVLLWALAGVRWYLAIALWTGVVAFAVVMLFGRFGGVRAGVCTLLLCVVLSAAMIDRGFPKVRRALFVEPDGPFVTRVARWIDGVRGRFERNHGATTIMPGRLLATPGQRGSAATRSAGALDGDGGSLRAANVRGLLTGAAAAFFPQFVIQPLGLARIGGAPGLRMFADLDTVVLDLVALYVIWWLTRNFNRRTLAPVASVVLVSLVTMAPLMVYTVTNFGTLFRLRQMLLIELVLIPLSMVARRRNPASDDSQQAYERARP